MAQDLPPTGGYEPVQYKRNLPARGFRPSYYLLAMGVICTYGLYKTGKGIREQKYATTSAPSLACPNKTPRGRDWSFLNPSHAGMAGELAREKMWSRIHLIPMLQAEEDRDLVRRTWADKARERELMGGETKVYHSDRFVRPTYSITPQNVTK
ncbi:MAG: hypothetical protein ASARMPRED_005694 [Alectoria sarmentosa]|nr:MAG: hypothetical protein ASARMPRED_005694 [Alectoria sarmentosa]